MVFIGDLSHKTDVHFARATFFSTHKMFGTLFVLNWVIN